MSLTPAELAADDAALKVLTNRLAEMAEAAPSHRLMLLALLATYQAVASVHPCCTRTAAEAALQVGGRLLISTLDALPRSNPSNLH